MPKPVTVTTPTDREVTVVREFDMTGRPMRNWVLVGPPRIAADDELAAWTDRGVSFARSLPPKA